MTIPDADRKRLIKNARAFYTNKDFGKAKIVFDELLMHYPIYIYEDVAKEYYIYRKSLIIYKLNDNMISFFDKWEFIKEGILLMDNLKKHNIDIDDLKNELEKIYFILNYKDIGEKCSFYIDDETQSFNKAESINRTSASEYDKYGYIKLWQNKEIVGNYALQLQNIKENMNNQMPPKTFMKEHKRKVGSIKAELYSFIIMILLTPLLPILMFYFVMEESALWMLGFLVSFPIAGVWIAKCISEFKDSSSSLKKEKDEYEKFCKQKELYEKYRTLFKNTQKRLKEKKDDLSEKERTTFYNLFQ